MPLGISKLESLRTLRGSFFPLSLSIEEDGLLRLEDVGKMSKIEEIRFQAEHESQSKRMEEGILAPLLKMRRLEVANEIFGMHGGPKSDLPHFTERMNAMKDLEHLTLRKFAVPSWICSLANLTFLCLRGCGCTNYPEFQAMPSLVTLFLRWNESCKELPKEFGKLGGFPRLRFLDITGFPEFEEFPKVDDGAIACLEKCCLKECRKVNKVGDGLEWLRRLEEFRYWETGTGEFREMFKEDGIYWKKIKAINPHIAINCAFD